MCSNTVVSKFVYDWIAGRELDVDGKLVYRPGKLGLFSNIADGKPLARPRTILVDSAQLESGGALKGDFKDAAAAEIVAFKTQYRLDHPGADVDNISDEDILREVMNTVGKPWNARCRRALRRQRRNVDRGLGCEHRHPHSRCAGVQQSAVVRAGDWPWASSAVIRAQ